MKHMSCHQNSKSVNKVIIAGGTGFIGKRLVSMLEKSGILCYVLTRRKAIDTYFVKYIDCDLNSLTMEKSIEINNQYGPFDTGIYLAANIPQIGARKENYYDATNSTLIPTINFSEGFAPFIKQIIYASSIDVVGTPKENLYDEFIETNPTTPYAVAKLSGEYYIKSIANRYGVTYSILRFSQVYGPFEPMVRVIPILIKTAKENNVFSLYGNGEEKRRFLYVDDAASSIRNALDYHDNGLFNIAGKSINSIRELISIVENVYKKNIRLEIKELNTNVFDNIPSIEAAQKELLYNPKYSLDEGIRNIFEEEHKNELR